mmetsp:Transcript_3362/g.7872  ORF Transcript_3362/g.7872 Transcript_3362/m.7872 type:complete len:248 (+) Transcript_3362:458-1201(+)
MLERPRRKVLHRLRLAQRQKRLQRLGVQRRARSLRHALDQRLRERRRKGRARRQLCGDDEGPRVLLGGGGGGEASLEVREQARHHSGGHPGHGRQRLGQQHGVKRRRGARHALGGRGGCGGVAHEGQERAVVAAPHHQLIPRRRRAHLLDLLEKIKAGPIEIRELHKLDKLGRGMVRERARDGGVDVVDVDLVAPDEILERLGRGGSKEEAAEEPQVSSNGGVHLDVSLLVEQLAVHLRRIAAKQRA